MYEAGPSEQVSLSNGALGDVVKASKERWFDLSSLGHPFWWAALALLLVNDDLLKGRHIVPGWLTGKLSDFAFLIVAPTLLAALLPLALRGRRTLALMTVVGVFVAADLSPTASDAIVALAARVGLRWRLWPDVTDLVALGVLPLTIWLMRRSPAARRGAAFRAGEPARHRRERAGVVLGAIACLATSAPLRALYAPFLVNRTAGVADVRITWVLTKVDCATSLDDLSRALGPSDLYDPRTFTLTSGQVAALDQPSLPGQSPAGQCRLDPNSTLSCVAAILESSHASPVIMLARHDWEAEGSGAFITCEAPPPLTRCQPTLDPSVDPGFEAVSLVMRNGQAQFTVSDHAPDAKVRIAPIGLAGVAGRPAAPGGCRELRDAYHTQLAATVCATNSDCDVAPALAVPGETPATSACGSYLNRAAATDVRTLEERFTNMCQGEALSCDAPDPPGCVNGQCVAVCVGANLPYCPLSCAHYPNVDFREAQACNTNVVCFADDGRRCHCAADTLSVVCAPDPPTSSSCPYACRPTPGYGDAGYVDRSDGGAGAGLDAASDVRIAVDADPFDQ
jgi:hypothetical protein